MNNDYEYNRGILKMFSIFSEATASLPFSYDTDNPKIKIVIDRYGLRYVAGDGDQFCRVTNIMSWLRDKVSYNGMTKVHPDYDSWSLLEYAFGKPENGLNCRMLATLLVELLLGLGMKSRIVSLHSITPYDADNHVVTLIWHDELRKWIFVDPSFTAYFLSDNGVLMNPLDLRNAMADGKRFQCFYGVPFGGIEEGAEERFLSYMSKNLFCMHSPLKTTFGSEYAIDNEQRWVYVSPIGFDYKNRERLSISWRCTTQPEIKQMKHRGDMKKIMNHYKQRVTEGVSIYTSSMNAFFCVPSQEE